MVVAAVALASPGLALAAGVPGRAGSPTPIPVAEAVTRTIEVDLSEQRLTAWQGSTRVRVLVVSTGDEEHPTIRGQFKIKAKYEKIDMIGRDYYYHNVPYVMMFSRPFYIHAAPWREKFGAPLSRGCVTLSTHDAEWLFKWAPVGTAVVVHR
jgi:lipoprotein-anchoring transpeptidase ErfK/SrfK